MTVPVHGVLGEYVAENQQTGTTYTLVAADQCLLIVCTNGSAITVTVPTNASLALPRGWNCSIMQGGAGQVTIAGSGITFQSTPGLKLRAQYSTAWLTKRHVSGDNTWLVTGDLAA